MELFAKIVNGLQPLAIFAKKSVLDVLLGSEYSSPSYCVLSVTLKINPAQQKHE